MPSWSTDRLIGGSSLDPADEHRESIVGRSKDPRRASETRHRCWADQCGKVHGAEERPAVPGLEDVLRNHADGIAAMDMFVVPTISFRVLYCLLIIGHGRRQILWIGVTAHPTAEWIANNECIWRSSRAK